MTVTVQVVSAEDLSQVISDAKTTGQRILALSPQAWAKTSKLSKDFIVTSYTLVTQ